MIFCCFFCLVTNLVISRKREKNYVYIDYCPLTRFVAVILCVYAPRPRRVSYGRLRVAKCVDLDLDRWTVPFQIIHDA